ncbi:MAG: FAD-binding oxidoreductase [Cohaesibacter sp.]|nr:FAD-binding oxidoreductase [Cohaesibacter sp.]
MGYDVIVLGAGMVGVCTALSLQKAGLDVALVDRRGAGEETSHGNAGVIERDGHVPIGVPSDFATLMKFAGNQQIAMRYDPLFLPKIAPWLYQLWRLSNSKGIDAFAHGVEPIRKKAAESHLALAREAGVEGAFRDNGWLHLYDGATFASAEPSLHYAREFGLNVDLLDKEGLVDLEPSLTLKDDAKAIFWKDTLSVSSPKRVTKAYAGLFEQRGGDFLMGDAQSLLREGDLWFVRCQEKRISAPRVVVALGPWSMDLLKPLGYRFPMAVKRGYHRHFGAQGNAVLHRPIVDEVQGFLLTPMEDGIRLTTGIEFADRDSAKSRGQLEDAAKAAQSLFPLGEAVEAGAWRGARPCFPDALPIVDASGDGNGLYFNFGHGHLGFSSGPLTGQLIADLMMQRQPCLDPAPYSASRFSA